MLYNALDEFKYRKGNGELRRAVLAANTGSHAQSELLAQRILQRAGLTGFRANFEVSDQQGLIGYIDIAFVDRKIAIEIDGYMWHSERARFQHDRRRQNRLTNLGWQVLRFTWDDLKNRAPNVAETTRIALKSRANPSGW